MGGISGVLGELSSSCEGQRGSCHQMRASVAALVPSSGVTLSLVVWEALPFLESRGTAGLEGAGDSRLHPQGRALVLCFYLGLHNLEGVV